MATAKMRNGLTPDQWEELRDILVEKRDEIKTQIAGRGSEYQVMEADEQIEDFDWASTQEAQAVSLRILHKERNLLRLVEKALAKFETGEFGLCEGTDEPIGYKRLKVVPWAKWSVAYKEELEQEEQRNAGKLPGR